MGLNTSTGFGQLDELQDRVVGGIGFIASIRMPTISDIGGPVFPKVLCRVSGLVGGDNVEIRVPIIIVVGQRVDVQC